MKLRFEGIFRYFMCCCGSSVLPLYIVTEYPKSGGSWFCQMLSACLQVPFPRNRLPRLESCIMQGHYMYNPLFGNAICVIRDGRDVMVSLYYYSYFKNELDNTRLVERTCRDLPVTDPWDIESNLPRFIEYKFSNKGYPRFNWSEFVDSWLPSSAIIVRYEYLLRDAQLEMSKVIQALGKPFSQDLISRVVEKYSFYNQAKRRPGEESPNSFLRKGIAGDWKNVFTMEAKEVFNHYAAKSLIKAGYEVDDSWVTANLLGKEGN